MSDILSLLPSSLHKPESLLSYPANLSGVSGMSALTTDTDFSSAGSRLPQNALSALGMVSNSIGDQLDVIQSLNVSSQSVTGQFSGSLKAVADSTELAKTNTANIFDVKSGTAASALLPSIQNSKLNSPLDPATGQPKMRFLSDETALRVASQTQNDLTITAGNQSGNLLRSFSGSSTVIDQLKDIIVSTQGRPYQTSDDIWIQGQQDSINRGQVTLLQVRQSLAQWSAQHGMYDSVYFDLHDRAPGNADRQYAATMIGNGWSLQDYRWHEAHGDVAARDYITMFIGVTGYQPGTGDVQWLQNAAGGGQNFSTLRNNLAWSDFGRNAIAKTYDEIHGQVAQKNELDYGCQKLAAGQFLSDYRRTEAYSERTAEQYRAMFAGITGYQPGAGDVQWLQNAAAGGQSFSMLRNNLAWSDFGRNAILKAYHDIGNLTPYETAVQSWQTRLSNGETYAVLRAGIASVHASSALNDLARSVLGRTFTSNEISAYRAQLVDGKSLNDIRAFVSQSVFSDPSLYGPNLFMNTQGVVNGQIQFHDKPSSLNGDISPDWGVIQWNGQSALDPAAGTSSQVWDKNFGYSVGHWTQGSATSSAGKTEYNVFRDPKDGHYVYQMAAQGGKLLDVQLSTLGSVDHRYSFDHQITASLDQGISDYQGSTGSYQAGINFNINYHSNNLQFGLFLQFEAIDYTGAPEPYSNILPSLGGSIYNVTGSQTAYIDPTKASNNGVMYHTTIDVNQGLMAAIKRIERAHPELAGEIENLSNWYLDGVYIGVETIGTGKSSDVTGKYNVKDPVVLYDKSKNVSYANHSTSASIVSMTPLSGA